MAKFASLFYIFDGGNTSVVQTVDNYLLATPYFGLISTKKMSIAVDVN